MNFCKCFVSNRNYLYGIILPSTSHRFAKLTVLSASKKSKYADILSDLNISDDAKQRVSLILERIDKGTTENLVTPYLNERSLEDLTSGLDDIFNRSSSKLPDPLIELEQLNRDKIGTMSEAKPWSLRKESIIDSYDEPLSGKTFAPYSLGIEDRLRPISVENAIGYLKNDSNSGFDDVTKKKRVKEKFLGYTLDSLDKIISETLYYYVSLWKSHTWPTILACILFTRTQEQGKTRNVWGYPIIATIFEMLFYRPLLDIQSKQEWRSALRKPDDVSMAITKLIDYAIANGLDILSMDFSGYDNSVKFPLINSAFDTIASAFQKQYKKYIMLIRDLMIEIPILTPDGILTGPHGIPSGSTFTNEVGSIVQRGVSLECKDIANHDVSQIQGDDGVYVVLDAIRTMTHFRRYHFEVNFKKSYIAKNWCVYLQSLYHADLRDDRGMINGVYPIYRAFNRILHLERFDNFEEYDINGPDYFSIRTISILENCKYHPLFTEFVTYIWSLDKYKLKVSDQGLANYVKKLAFQEGKDITFRNWSYGSDTAGLKSFACVKLINELNSRV